MLKNLVIGSLLAVAMIGCQNTAEGAAEDTQKNTEAVAEGAAQAAEATANAVENVAASTLTARIKTALVANPITNDPSVVIDVDSTEEKVVLNGHTATQEQKNEAEQIAKKVLKDLNAKQPLENMLEVKAPS